jgi:general secretion pathway protein G
MLLATFQRDRQKAARRAGFTLLEVLVVVAILVILASVAIIYTTRYLEDSRKTKAQLQAKSLVTAIEAYTMHPANQFGEQPRDWSLLLNPGIGGSFLKNGQEDIIDPWGGTFQIGYIQDSDGVNFVPIVYTRSKDGTMISNFGMADASKVNLIQ